MQNSNNLKFKGFKDFFKYIDENFFDKIKVYKLSSYKFLRIILFIVNASDKNNGMYKRLPRKMKKLKEYYNFISKVVLDYIIVKGELSLETYKLDSIMNVKISPYNVTNKNGYIKGQYKNINHKIYSYPSQDVFIIYPRYRNNRIPQAHKQYFSSYITKGNYLKIIRKELDKYFNNEPIKYFNYAVYKYN